MANTFAYTNGDKNIATVIETDDSVALTDAQKKRVICVAASAASKTVTLGLAEGESALVVNNGSTNAFTLKNVSGDTGTSVAAGKVALIVASLTANGSNVYVLN